MSRQTARRATRCRRSRSDVRSRCDPWMKPSLLG
jgi:hypothetical protein